MAKATDRIYNPITKKHYAVRSKTTKTGKPGQIEGLWAKETKSKVVMIQMSEGMYKQILEQAGRKHMNLQEYIRYLVTRNAEELPEYYE